MSLSTDSIFIAALKTDAQLTEMISGRLYGTSIGVPDEDLDNAPVPYVIVTFDGMNNQEDTKDEPYEGEADSVRIGVEVVAKTLNDLHVLTQKVREVVLQYFRTAETNVMDYVLSAGQIQYDSWKPCYWQVLSYQCDVYNHLNDDEENGNN